jgi:cysteine-rich repeat protein
MTPPSRPALALALLLSPACFKDPGVDGLTTEAETTASSTSSTSQPTTQADTTDTTLAGSSELTGDPGVCGDGTIDPDEACDDGDKNGAQGPCTPVCQLNVCGDGYDAASELCDDNNLDDGDGCTATCVPEVCGDNIVAAPTETCDRGVSGTDGCVDCQLTYLRVFTTDALLSGDLMGFTLADDICAEEATKAGLGGTFRAWLSTPKTTPTLRFTASALPYRRTDGTMLAANLESLLTTGPQLPLGVTADGKPLVSDAVNCDNYVWTGTIASGLASEFTCDGFVTASLNVTGTVGNFNAVTEKWTSACPVPCDSLARLYCFEQVP